MSELDTAVIDKIRNGEPLTGAERSLLARNPAILTELTEAEVVRAKFQYDLPLTEAEVDALRADPLFGADSSVMADALITAFRAGTITENQLRAVVDTEEEPFERLAALGALEFGEGEAGGLRTGLAGLAGVGLTGGTTAQQTEILAYLGLRDLTDEQMKEIMESLVGAVGPGALKRIFAGTSLAPQSNAVIDTHREGLIDEVLAAQTGTKDRALAEREVDIILAEESGATVGIDVGGGVERQISTELSDLARQFETKLGVSQGFTVTRDGKEVSPLYSAQNIWRDESGRSWADMPMEIRLGMQADMVAAGLLEPGAFRPGVWDEITMNAWERLLIQANTNAETWQDAAAKLKVTPFQEGFDPAIFLTPDPSELASDVRRLFVSNLGRLPTDIEMAELADELSLNHRLDFEAGLEAQRAKDRDIREQTAAALADASGLVPVDSELAFSSRQRNREFDADIEAPTLDQEGITADIQDVNPQTRLEESFFDKYGPLIDYRRERNDAVEAKSDLMQSVLNLDALIRQGTGF